MKSTFSLSVGIILCACLVFVTAAASQERNPALDETLTLRLGPLFSSFDTTIKVLGQEAKSDEDIDVNEVNFAAYGLWRITERIRLEAGYSGIDQDSDVTIDNVPGLGLTNKFETSVARFALGYAIYRGDSSEFGVDLGINYTTIKNTTRFAIPGTELREEGLDVSEPLPTIGLFFNYAFNEKWYFTSRAGAFTFDIGDIDGTIIDVWAGVEVRPWQHFGAGLAFLYNSADVDIKDDNLTYDVDYDYYGPLLYLVVGF